MVYGNFIDGEIVNSDDFFSNTNPSDLTHSLGEFCRSTEDDVVKAIDSSYEAFGVWSQFPVLAKSEILSRISREIDNNSYVLGEVLSSEEGKTISEGISEVKRAAQIFSYYAQQILMPQGDTIPNIRSSMSVQTNRVPVGVVGIITPWNFPCAIPAWKIAPAIAYGNTVVFKPAEIVSASAWHLVKIFHKCGLPRGVVNLVMGKGSLVGSSLTSSKKISAISFTGSTSVGLEIAKECALANKKYQLEMGGKNATVVLDDANIDFASDSLIQSCYYSTGQRCTATSRIIATPRIYDELKHSLISKIKNLKVGHALHRDTDIGPVVSESQLKSNLRYVDVGLSEGANLEIGGRRIKNAKHHGYYFEPTLFSDVLNDSTICQEEIFGPIATLIRAKDFEEAVHISNLSRYGLASGIITNSLKYAEAFKKYSNTGMVMVNSPTAGTDFNVPFGGVKDSSFGPREQGCSARSFYTTEKSIYTSYF
ncbi:MAG: aldehyde dehydrogenase family protein [Marinomonas foliarum]|uniref:aldehyde dehydrogenase family protein n=1 Tax=Marinomonas foliarum TaxID=491950 RepID=UPI003F9AC1DD